MNKPARATAAILVFVVGVVGIGAVVYYIATHPEKTNGPISTTGPTTTTGPVTQPVVQRPPRTYGELLKAAYPQLATTQPMGVPLNVYTEAAHVVLTDPIYVCSRGDLWITRDHADPGEAVLAAAVAPTEQTHLTRDHIAFIHWSPDDRGRWRPRMVSRRADGSIELVSADSRVPIGGKHAYLWHRALSWGNAIVVPTESGLSIFKPIENPNAKSDDKPSDQLEEVHHAFASPETSNEPPAEPQVTFDVKGIIAWMPWDDGKRGSTGAVRFAEGKFSPLGPAEGWPEKLVHVVPLLDGSVLQIVRDENGKIVPRLELLNQGNVDEKTVTALVEQLSDADPDKRQQAYNELTRYGPLVWPLLEKLAEDQPPEARIRLQQLLANKTQPTMGGLTLVDGNVATASRLPDGGVVFFAAEGVSFARENAEPAIVKPAWISIRPGRAVELLPDKLLAGAAPPQHQVYAYGDEWVLVDSEHGAQHLLYNHMPRLLHDNEKAFSRLHAIDRRGRWLFRKPTDGQPTETLIVDPTFPDPTPHLPIWIMTIYQGSTGWDEGNWPVIKSGGAWALRERGWAPLDETKKRMLTELPLKEPKSPGAQLAEPLLVDADGTRYFDGATMLHVVTKDNKHTVWPLPLSARGNPGGTLLRAADGRLFLFNSPGRICRIKPIAEGKETYKLDGTFTYRVPKDQIARIWLDPANRICVVFETNKLAIMFPEGHIPPHIATMIPAAELK
jgi:hypothetical protein